MPSFPELGQSCCPSVEQATKHSRSARLGCRYLGDGLPMRADFPPSTGSRVRLGRATDFDLSGLRVRPARREVVFDGETRILEPRVMQVLVALAECRPSVVSRDQLALVCWGGLNVGDDAINRCVVALRRLARDFEPTPFSIETVPRVGYSLIETGTLGKASTRAAGATANPLRNALPLSVIAVAIVAMVAIYFLWRANEQQNRLQSLAVIAASSDHVNESLARDLTAKLGMLDSVSEGNVRLLDRPGPGNADLLFQVDASAQERGIETNLVLLNAKREVLWSKDFQQARTNLPDLKQQLAFTAGKVLQCALETRSNGAEQLDRQTTQLYLNGCAAFADLSEGSLDGLHAIFSRVTRQAPAFESGWAMLLASDTENVKVDKPDLAQIAAERALLLQTIAGASKHNTEMPEIYLARAALTPGYAIAERGRLVEEAVDKRPDNVEAISVKAGFLESVGRTNDSVRMARQAVRLDPLSPTVREALVSALATADRLPEAEAELKRAEQLWPGALSLRDASYRLSLRFADPKEAIRLRNSGMITAGAAHLHGSFLEARANPTPANVEKALRDARAYYSADPATIHHLAQTLGTFGREEELFPIFLNWNRSDDVRSALGVLFRPSLHNFRRDPRMMRVAAHLGLLEYWRTSGHWPDFCFEPDLPYDCKKEALSLSTP